MLKGSIVALVTPFKENGEINQESLENLINWHIDNKTDAILICGTTGESATLSHDEHKKLIDLTVKAVNKRIPVIAGCGSNSTKEALDLTAYAKSAGADYALVITPYYNKPTQEGLYQHFKTIADTVGIEIILYNVPSRTGSNILPETVLRLYNDCNNIVGIKEASGNLDQIIKIIAQADEDLMLFSGSDELTLPILSVGGRGAISVVANIVPKENHDFIHSFLKGNLAQAREKAFGLYELIKALFIETNPIPAKTALGLMGLIEPYLRLPLYRMNDSNLEKLKSVLVKYRLIEG